MKDYVANLAKVEAKLCHTQKLKQLFENDIGRAHASERKCRFGEQHARRNVRVESATMTFIRAKIVAFGKEADNRTNRSENEAFHYQQRVIALPQNLQNCCRILRPLLSTH
jgi:hypothetical protein